MDERVYYEKYGLLFSDSPKWENYLYQFPVNGMGDCITGTMCQDIESGSTDHLQACSDLLNLGKRWPDECNDGNEEFIAQNRWEWELSKLNRFWQRLKRWDDQGGPWKRLEKADQVKFRPQHHITRDPVCWYYQCAILNGKKEFIHKYHPPWNINSPTFWAWVRYIKTGKGEWLYLLLEDRKPLFKPRTYVNQMKEGRLKVYNYLKSES